MLATISSTAFAKWMEYYEAEPFGEIRGELRHGQIMAMTANLNRNEKKRPAPFTAEDFMNFQNKPVEKKQSKAEVSAGLRKIFAGAKRVT